MDGVNSPYANFVNDFGGSATVAQALVPYPQYSYIFNNFEGYGTTYYQSAQIEVEKRFTNGLSFLAGYTLSHLMDNTSSGFSSFTSGGINKYNQKPEWAVSNSDEPQTLKASGTYELPIGPGKKYRQQPHHSATWSAAGRSAGSWIMRAAECSALGENGTPFPNGFDRPDRNSSVGLSTAALHEGARLFRWQDRQSLRCATRPAFTVTPSQYVLGTAQRNYARHEKRPAGPMKT